MQYGPLNNLELISRTIDSEKKHGNAKKVSLKDKGWRVVNSKVNWVGSPHTRWVSLGSSNLRERLFFDENSSHVTSIKKAAEKACKGKNVGEVLTIVNNLINQLTAIEGKSDKEIEKGLDAKLNKLLIEKRKSLGSHTPIDIHFDELIEKKILVCRHKGLLAASILAHLVEKGILPKGNVRQYRSSLKKNGKIIGAHTWAVYRDATTDDLWICDPRWRTANNTTKEFEELAKRYGNPTMSDMVKRLAIEDGKKTKHHKKPEHNKKVPSDKKTQMHRDPMPIKVQPAPAKKADVLFNFEAGKQGKGLKFLLDQGAQDFQSREKRGCDKWIKQIKQPHLLGYCIYRNLLTKVARELFNNYDSRIKSFLKP